MARILLVNPPNANDAYRSAFGFICPPLGLCSIAAMIRHRGHKVALLDLNQLSDKYGVNDALKVLEATVNSFNAEYVGISINATCTAPISSIVAKKVKELNDDIICIAGGHHATFRSSDTLRSGFDYVVKGEGEITFTELIDALEFGDNVNQVKGIAYMNDGRYVETSSRGFIENLDALPIPAIDLLSKKNYILKAFGEGSSIITAETSRGCPYNCDFCSASPMWGHRWRVKSNQRILYELEEIKKDGWKYVFFVDDNFITPLNIEVRRKLFQDIIREGIDLEWICQIRADTVVKYPDLIKLASSAGMRVAFIGVESGDEKVLRRMHKGIIPLISEKAITILKKIGVVTLAGFIIGAPYESFIQTYRTLKFALKLCSRGLDAAQFSIFTPLPGSRAFIEAAQNKLLATKNWALYDCLRPVLKKNRITSYLAMRWANYIFYLYKWLRGIFSGNKKFNQLIIEEASKYLMRNLPKHVLGFLKLPLEIIRIITE